jgi:hypothetical protein
MAVMKILTEKIIVRLLIIMIGIHFIAAPAGAVNLHAEKMCCCSAMSITPYKPLSAVYSSGDECCSCSTKSSCNFKKNNKYEPQIFLISTARENQQKSGGIIFFVICDHSFFHSVKGWGAQTHFPGTNDFIPIYLQNSVLIC